VPACARSRSRRPLSRCACRSSSAPPATCSTTRTRTRCPPIGIAGTLYLHRDKVRIVAGRYEATHERQRESGAKSTLPEHRAQHVAAVSGKRAKRYLKREHLVGLGGAALDYLTELVHRRPQVWIRDVDRLHELLESHGEDALRGAFERGLADGVFGHEYVAHHLAHTAPLQKELPL
jgi:hypothetical protein